ncbi:similar to Saccharomyces cerevisiae YOL073C Putative protein of unknown function [Maudiozyma barnettii]|uniref:Derlin n=1 Tax=Maudiozyma barnettii TaxID=61262 RepID=A0A8H2VK21_9SACH|nr:Dsc2p [Kazachstania barnettii]CAB4257216.1 similar to Saccharomyces cerevisiae YOL073C Putative protein of unknown function [Kazachstania barnettii]CAD1779586.1 similar to Saccharomyces cerevisiae YOL073C Putative protein of unknown function [Kazachstania barnettii]
MSVENPTGLHNYPVTRTCMILTAVVPFLMAVTNDKYIFLAQYDPFINQYHQYYRFFIYQFCAVNESDVMLLLLLWYDYRHVERLFGSYKYINVILLTLIYTTGILSLLNVAVNVLFPAIIWNKLPTGTLPTVLALFHFYKQYTPQLYEVNLSLSQPWFGKSSNSSFRWTINNQVFLNITIILLLLNQGLVGIGCGLICWIIGIFMEKGLLPGVDNWRLPFLRHVSHLDTPLSGSSRYRMIQSQQQTTELDALNGIQGENVHPDDEAPDEPERSLGVQFLDTFRR